MSIAIQPRPDRRIARGNARRAEILAAAREILREQGYAAMNTRAVAERAGAQLSLMHYHFGSKRGLLMALLEHENEQLLERQRALYDGPESLAEKWRTACAYLREDVRSGYVRILWELWAAGLADEELASRWRAAIAAWRRLIERVFLEWSEQHQLDLPMSPRLIATLVGNLFEGAEVELLAAVSEDEAPHYEALEACAVLIERLEREARPR